MTASNIKPRQLVCVLLCVSLSVYVAVCVAGVAVGSCTLSARGSNAPFTRCARVCARDCLRSCAHVFCARAAAHARRRARARGAPDVAAAGAMRAVLPGPGPGPWLWLLLAAALAAGSGSEHPRLRETVLQDLARGKVEVSAGGDRGTRRGRTGARRVPDGVSSPTDLRRVTAESPQGGTYWGRAGPGRGGESGLPGTEPSPTGHSPQVKAFVTQDIPF